MTKDFFEFSWPVQDRGYRWENASAWDDPRPPEPLREGATESKGNRLELNELLSRPRLFLIGDPREAAHCTFPLTHFKGDLHRVFAGTESTPDGIIDFANKFGMLGCDLATRMQLTSAGNVRSDEVGESYADWAFEITDAADAVELWDLVRKADDAGLSERVHWDGDSVHVKWSECRKSMLVASRSFRAPLFEELKPGEPLEAALLAVQLIVNEHISKGNRAAPRLLWNTDTRSLDPAAVPAGLVGAIWLDFLLAVSGRTEYRRCEWCREPFPVKPKGQKAKFCSIKCRSAAHRSRHGQVSA